MNTSYRVLVKDEYGSSCQTHARLTPKEETRFVSILSILFRLAILSVEGSLENAIG